MEVKLVDHPDGQGREKYVLCRSHERHQKEAAMLQRQRDRLRDKLDQIDAGLGKRPQKPDTIQRRIGRWLGRNTLAEKLFKVKVHLDSRGYACGLGIEESCQKLQWAQLSQGAYLLRTNCQAKDPQSLWHWYIQLTQAEEAFRCAKSDLGLRPVFHQKEDRVAGTHPGLFPGLSDVAHPGKLAEFKGLG